MAETTRKRPGRQPVSALVLWTGLALGTFLATAAIIHGVALPIPGVGPLITFALILAAGVVLAETARRHHRTVIRHGGRLSAAGTRHAYRHGRTALAWLAAKAAPRWERRQHQPLMIRRLRGGPDGPAAATAPAGEEEAAPAGASPPPPDDPDGGHDSMTVSPSRIKTGHRAQRAARTGSTAVPSEWAPVITQTADFEPEDDGELLDWMSRQLTGLSGWAEALVDFYEHATNVIGIDPKASTILHDVADAAAQAAETMAAAKARFTEHYELPREFAGNGGLMTHDGRWITGEGA